LTTARALQAGGATLIFPAEQSLSGTNPSIANVILAEIQADDEGEIRRLTGDVRNTCIEEWMRLAETAREEIKNRITIRESVWSKQLSDAIDFYAAWVALPDGQYMESRQRLARVMAGRKACRTFLPAPQYEFTNGESNPNHAPKSSLDGARETVLPAGKDWRKRLPLSEGEQLDAIGLIKRFGGGSQRWPSVSRIAADPWIRRVTNDPESAATWQKLLDECSRLSEAEVIDHLPKLQGHYATFPYDASVLYQSRHLALTKEAGKPDDSVFSTIAGLLQQLKIAGDSEPSPYLAVIKADGDRVGEKISTYSKQRHAWFSDRLAEFSLAAKDVIEDHFGTLVYAGGDDLLALVPVDQCIAAARRLRDSFVELWETPQQLSDESADSFAQLSFPTLSVGVIIGHSHDALEDLLNRADETLQLAKEGFPDDHRRVDGVQRKRDALAVTYEPRSGAGISVRDHWLSPHEESDSAPMDVRIEEWATFFRDGLLPQKAAYDIRRVSDTYRRWDIGSADGRERLGRAIRADLLLTLSRKLRSSGGAQGLVRFQHAINDQIASADDASRLGNEVIIAGRISEAQRLASPNGVAI
jgi:CRISPR-associated protein Cmr2